MGRKAGVTAEQTRAELLAAAARVFALKGYDGASIADITSEAGLSTGAVYVHYGSKAELFGAVLLAHGQRQYADLMGNPDVHDVADFVQLAGSRYDRRQPGDAALVVEAIVASKRDPEAAELVASWLRSAEGRLASSIKRAQADGVIDSDVSPNAFSRLATMIALGSFLTAALDVPAPNHKEWEALIGRLVDAMRTD